MWLKVTIIVLFVAMLLSLSSAFRFLMKDQNKDRRRTQTLLGIRVAIAVSIIGLIIYGLVTGTLSYTDPFA